MLPTSVAPKSVNRCATSATTSEPYPFTRGVVLRTAALPLLIMDTEPVRFNSLSTEIGVTSPAYRLTNAWKVTPGPRMTNGSGLPCPSRNSGSVRHPCNTRVVRCLATSFPAATPPDFTSPNNVRTSLRVSPVAAAILELFNRLPSFALSAATLIHAILTAICSSPAPIPLFMHSCATGIKA